MVLLPFHPDFGPGDLSISQDTVLYDPSRPSKTTQDLPRPPETLQDPPRPPRPHKTLRLSPKTLQDPLRLLPSHTTVNRGRGCQGAGEGPGSPLHTLR